MLNAYKIKNIADEVCLIKDYINNNPDKNKIFICYYKEVRIEFFKEYSFRVAQTVKISTLLQSAITSYYASHKKGLTYSAQYRCMYEQFILTNTELGIALDIIARPYFIDEIIVDLDAV